MPFAEAATPVQPTRRRLSPSPSTDRCVGFRPLAGAGARLALVSRNQEQLQSVAREVRECEAALDGSGRVLVRFSGTEPLARVMVEASDPRQVEEFSARIAGAIQREIG